MSESEPSLFSRLKKGMMIEAKGTSPDYYPLRLEAWYALGGWSPEVGGSYAFKSGNGFLKILTAKEVSSYYEESK